MGDVLFDSILGRLREGGDGGGGGKTPQIYTVDNIQNISNDLCEKLKVGDVVIWLNSASFVQSKSSVYLYLVSVMNGVVDETLYYYSGGTWSYLESRSYPIFTPALTTIPRTGMKSNVVYNLGVITEDTNFSFDNTIDSNQANIWYWTFNTGARAPMITWPQQITMWADGEAPTIEANKYYEINVMNGLACVVSADVPQNS